ncbi:MAG: hypothetical protein JRE64_11320 [Deltaproteobacteria bacterium]|nr:hypothetical protein [Deltaproteobacteria bacterium]
MKLKFRIVIFLLILVCFRGVCTGNDISGSADLNYFTTETKTGEEEKSSWGFTQNYNLQVTKEFNPKVNFAANLGININETNEAKTTRLTPDIRLNLRNEYFDADTGYRIIEQGVDILTMVADEDRMTTESWNVNFSTKSDKHPKVRLRYNENRFRYDEDMNYDHLAVRNTDRKITDFSGSADYTYRFLNFYYEYKNNVLDNYDTKSITETDTHYGRVDFRKSFWKNRLATSGSYSIINTKTETKTGSQGVEVAEKYTAYDGLYVQDTTPVLSTLASTPALINNSASINIGGIGNTNQNIGFELSLAEDVDLIYLYTEEHNFALSHTAFAWDVYSSADNNNWNLIISNADFEYNTIENRFEISFTKTNAMYFKIVNTTNDLNDLYVTEIKAYSLTLQAAYKTAAQESTTQTTRANLRYKPMDWLSFTYDFTQDEWDTKQDQEETDTDSEKSRRQTNYINCRVEKKLHRYITTWAQYGRRMEYDSEVENKTTDIYLLHFLSSPLTTLDTDLSFNHTVSKEDSETHLKSSSALLQISAKLREGADLNVDANITRSENIASQSETTTKSINSYLRLELTRMLTAEIEHDTIWTKIQQSEPDGDKTGINSSARVIVYWRPSHYFYFRGSYHIDRDEKSGEETTQQRYNMNWLMTEKMQLNMGYALNRNDTVNSTYSANLSWNLSRIFTLRFGYDYRNRQEEDVKTFTTNLSARF